MTDNSNDIENLRADVENAKRRKLFYDKLRKSVPLIGVTISISMMTVYYFYNEPIILGIGIFYFIVAITYPMFELGKSVNTEVEALESEISLRTTGSDAIELRAERLFKAHEIELRRYYAQSLKQNNIIFIVGVFCILAGFGFIALSFILIGGQSHDDNFNQKVLISVLGISSGILTNFVAIIYLKIFSNTLKAFTTFHNKLVSTNHLHFVNFLVSKIGDQDTRNQSLKVLSDKIADKI